MFRNTPISLTYCALNRQLHVQLSCKFYSKYYQSKRLHYLENTFTFDEMITADATILRWNPIFPVDSSYPQLSSSYLYTHSIKASSRILLRSVCTTQSTTSEWHAITQNFMNIALTSNMADSKRLPSRKKGLLRFITSACKWSIRSTDTEATQTLLTWEL